MRRTMWACASAAICVVTELMDVHSSFSAGVMATDVPANSRWGRLATLFKGNGTLDVRVTSKDSNYRQLLVLAEQHRNDSNC